MTDAIDLGDALDIVVASLAAQFPTFKTVAAEDESRSELKVPALIVQMSEIEPSPDTDVHTGQLPCFVRFEARIVLGNRTAKVRREVVKAAGAIATFIHSNRLGVEWGPAVIGAIEPDEFSPIANKFDVWRIEWVHEANLGDSYFVDDGVTPTELLISFAPEIGPDHEGDYVAGVPDV
ncbi:hypothetical protein AB9F29_16690 [Falsihalocynthiibacter sp. S25ZX9]|uniref:hypothetical protein n=1 Tax=Falsihalocynthiibacter sp. S25ZX9 TaxID=3240870 RepID=UPI00350F59AC